MTLPVALKVDADTLRGTLEGVPRLVEAMRACGAGGTFLFSLGPDHTGRAIRRALRPGFMRKVSRTSVLEHYGIRTLLYGTLLPGPDIGVRAADVMRAVRDAGFEVGIHTWDHVRWQDGVAGADAQWTEREMRLAFDRFREIFGEPARVHGAAGWQMNVHAYRLTQKLGFDYSSDTRGSCPFVPVHDAEPIACPQVPTTLPTLDELIGRDGMDAMAAAEHVLALCRESAATAHVFTLHAELEGMKLLPAFERLLAGWRTQGREIVTLRTALETAGAVDLPRHSVGTGTVEGRSGTLAVQAGEFLGAS